MLKLIINAVELYDENIGEFISTKGAELSLEHSLVSISKWESKWHKSFLSTRDKTNDELIDYVRCMTVTQNVDPNVYLGLTKKDITNVVKYINDPMTATTISARDSKPGRDVITAEIIYWQMISFGIPFECQKWHLNRLLTLIRVCGEKSKKPKQMSRNELRRRNSALNAARRKKLGSRG